MYVHASCRNRARDGGLCSVPLYTRNMQSYRAALVWQEPQKVPHFFLAAVTTLGAVVFGRKDGSEMTARQNRASQV